MARDAASPEAPLFLDEHEGHPSPAYVKSASSLLSSETLFPDELEVHLPAAEIEVASKRLLGDSLYVRPTAPLLRSPEGLLLVPKRPRASTRSRTVAARQAVAAAALSSARALRRAAVFMVSHTAAAVRGVGRSVRWTASGILRTVWALRRTTMLVVRGAANGVRRATHAVASTGAAVALGAARVSRRSSVRRAALVSAMSLATILLVAVTYVAGPPIRSTSRMLPAHTSPAEAAFARKTLKPVVPAVTAETGPDRTASQPAPQTASASVARAPVEESRTAVATDAVASRLRNSPTRQPAVARILARPVWVGTLHVTSEPAGAEVSLNGVPQGLTPLTIQDLRPGSRVVSLRLSGYDRWSWSVAVVADRETPLAVKLQPARSR